MLDVLYSSVVIMSVLNVSISALFQHILVSIMSAIILFVAIFIPLGKIDPKGNLDAKIQELIWLVVRLLIANILVMVISAIVRGFIVFA